MPAQESGWPSSIKAEIMTKMLLHAILWRLKTAAKTRYVQDEQIEDVSKASSLRRQEPSNPSNVYSAL